MPPRKRQSSLTDALSFATKKDEPSDDSGDEDLERGPDEPSSDSEDEDWVPDEPSDDSKGKASYDNEVKDLEWEPNQGFIYEVPKNILQANPKAYIPQSISIGPIHYRKTSLARMNKYKVVYKVKFLQRPSVSKETLESFWSFIKCNKKKILDCYGTLIDEKEFVKMIFYDALFIVELFLRNYEKEVEKLDINDNLLEETWSTGVRRDLILLENQIPMFVLEEAYKPYQNHNLVLDASVPSFLKLACYYFDIPWDSEFEKIKIPHFTALQRCHMTKTQNSSSNTDIPTLKKVYGATSLNEVGVELIVETDPTACLLDVKIDEHEKLKIPKLTVHSNTEAYFRNVMAFEMCHCPDEAYVCAYIELMNHLIQNAEDVQQLIEKGILSKEGKNEGKLISIINSDIMVQRMIKKLMLGIRQPAPTCYRETANQLNRLYKEARKHKVTLFIKENYGILKRVYFRNLWRGTGTVAAFMVVVLTFIQTVLAFVK